MQYKAEDCILNNLSLTSPPLLANFCKSDEILHSTFRFLLESVSLETQCRASLPPTRPVGETWRGPPPRSLRPPGQSPPERVHVVRDHQGDAQGDQAVS